MRVLAHGDEVRIGGHEELLDRNHLLADPSHRDARWKRQCLAVRTRHHPYAIARECRGKGRGDGSERQPRPRARGVAPEDLIDDAHAPHLAVREQARIVARRCLQRARPEGAERRGRHGAIDGSELERDDGKRIGAHHVCCRRIVDAVGDACGSARVDPEVCARLMRAQREVRRARSGYRSAVPFVQTRLRPRTLRERGEAVAGRHGDAIEVRSRRREVHVDRREHDYVVLRLKARRGDVDVVLRRGV